MTLSEAIDICERAAECYRGEGMDSEETISPQDWTAAAVIVLPKLRALRQALGRGLEISGRRVRGHLFHLRYGWFEKRGGWFKDWLWVKCWERRERTGGDTCGTTEPNGISLERLAARTGGALRY